METGYRTEAEWSAEQQVLQLGHRPGRWRLERGPDHAIEFDEEGRALRRESAGESWRFTLDGRVLRVGGTRDARRRLPPLVEADALLAAETGPLVSLLDAHPEDAELRAWLERALRFDARGLERDRAQLRRIYQPIPVLPPDQYDALVLQVTEGCPYDRCTFCNFYRGVAHRIRDERSFDAHLDAVLQHLGRSAERSSRVFLGQANAMLAPASRLARHMDLVAERLGRLPEDLPPARRRQWRRRHPTAIEGFYSFVDAFHRPIDAGDLRALRERGLRRLYLGLESGNSEVLDLLGKPTPAGAVEELTASLHDAGIGIAVIVLLGAGGRALREEHESATAQLLRRLDLRAGDQLYLSRLVVHEGSDYALRAEADGIVALDARELDESERRLRATVAMPVIAAPYDLAQISQWSPRL